MKINLTTAQISRQVNIAIRCPHCGHHGTFEPVGINDISTLSVEYRHPLPDAQLGIRRCPNKQCAGHLFFISRNDVVLATSPSNVIPFDKERIPRRVINAFEEAVNCHSNSCFIASAIMIRKTLEEVCVDRGAQGGNLFQKIQALGKTIVIPPDLINGMDELRLLGNDAAHIEAQTFVEVGPEEIEVSIDFTKEILKAVYQYENLLQKIKALKTKNSIISSVNLLPEPSDLSEYSGSGTPGTPPRPN